MQLTDEQWTVVQRAALAEAMRCTHGDRHRAEDLAAQAVKRMFSRGEEVAPQALAAFARRTVHNLCIDEARRRDAAMRGGPELGLPDEDVADVASLLRAGMLSRNTSLAAMWSRQVRARVDACERILAGLPDRKRRLVELAAQGVSHAEIARELGYANARTVTATLHRVHREIRDTVQLTDPELIFADLSNW